MASMDAKLRNLEAIFDEETWTIASNDGSCGAAAKRVTQAMASEVRVLLFYRSKPLSDSNSVTNK